VINAVVFDLDGVLIDSEPVWEQVRRHIVADHGGHWPAEAQSRLMSAPITLIESVLATTGLRESFAVVMSTEQVRNGKPAPDIYLAVTARLGVPPGECAAVEDSTNGLRSAAAAGLAVIAVPHPRYPPDPAALAQARLVLTDLTGLTVSAVNSLG
jgi:beta-phosphoglucomutase-like phosphatase (HAD superfamily)